jgi:hypothetical protein
MAKTRPPDATQSANLPVITPEEGIVRLQEMIERGNSLLAWGTSDEEISAYRIALDSALMDSFGNDPNWTRRISQAGVSQVYFSGMDWEKVRHDELRAKLALLPECINELKRRAARKPVAAAPAMPPALDTVENILRRFHRVALQLRNRHAGRKTLEIEDEYDVQDLLHGLLLVSFADVRPEETAPSVAGARPRLDFLLKEEQIVIEVKKTRETLSTKELGDELITDIARYQAHADCKTLVCFVYDPEGRVKNVDGFIRDLERSASKMPVRVLVVPPR